MVQHHMFGITAGPSREIKGDDAQTCDDHSSHSSFHHLSISVCVIDISRVESGPVQSSLLRLGKAPHMLCLQHASLDRNIYLASFSMLFFLNYYLMTFLKGRTRIRLS